MHIPQIPSLLKKDKYKKIIKSFYKYLYIVGVQTIRITKHIRRKNARFFRPLSKLCKRIYAKTLGKQIKNLVCEIISIKSGFIIQAKRIQQAKKDKGIVHAIGEYFKTAKKGFVLHKGFLCSILNIFVPIISITVLAFTVNYWTNLEYGLTISYANKEIAAIQDESIFEKANEMVNQRMIHDTKAAAKGTGPSPKFTLSVMDKSRYESISTVCDKIIEQSDGIIEEASGLYVDGKLIGAVKSSADLSYILQNILNTARGTETNTKVSFVQNVQTITGLFPSSSIIDAQTMNKQLMKETSSAVNYTVKSGDTLSTIASKYEMSIGSLTKLNTNLNEDIAIGQNIKVQSAKSFLGVKLIKQDKYQIPIAFKTVTVKDDNKYTDYSKVTVEGANGVQECIDEVTYVDGEETSRETVKKTVVTNPINKTIVTGTKRRRWLSDAGESSGNLMWPVPSIHNITSVFGARWGRMHSGIDISGGSSYGRTIVAADGGTVSFVKYSNYGYGNHLQINHGGGISTLYGHTSKILVSSGQRVAKGQPIALIGSTGDSTGAHLHFEVIRSGQKRNPLSYVRR